MRFRIALPFLAALVPVIAAAQSASPVADAFRNEAKTRGKNLMAAAEVMPADKYGFKPTPAQMSFGDVVLHLAGGNDAFCSAIGGVKAPTRSKLAAADGKAALTARLKETFDFCNEALAKLDDSKLGEPMNMFGMSSTRAGFMLIAADDWGDHYSQSAIYLRLNGLLPPTAKPPAK
jgi:uncharacterized damage-inducible protein DinB